MLQSLTKDEIAQRVKAINRNARWLGRAAKVDPMTVARGAKTITKQAALQEALIAEEIRLRDYLLSLHPLPAAERTAA